MGLGSNPCPESVIPIFFLCYLFVVVVVGPEQSRARLVLLVMEVQRSTFTITITMSSNSERPPLRRLDNPKTSLSMGITPVLSYLRNSTCL
ncbi:hypothetical protein LY78DRAFT_148750 [Colletotrichum sublineola]|nr:hypothetical protein LY78DRAFT_148750 [Colletotrichum sublineola]